MTKIHEITSESQKFFGFIQRDDKTVKRGETFLIPLKFITNINIDMKNNPFLDANYS